MKIESSKTTSTEKATDKRTAPTDKPGTAFQSLFDARQKPDLQPPSAGFAKILEEARSQNAKDEDSLFNRKSERSEQSSETAADADEEIGKTTQNQEKVEDENRQPDGGEESDEQDDNPTFASPQFPTLLKPTAETAAPAARAILHVADLERIVATVRAQNLKNAEQLVIALKHSVLEGLQIKLTLDENGTLKAEFLAANEQIKNHLNARKLEIRQIFRERGVRLSDLSVRQDSEFARSANPPEANFSPDETSEANTNNRAAEANDVGDQTSYRI